METQIKWTPHLVERLNERFGLSPDHLQSKIGESSNVEYRGTTKNNCYKLYIKPIDAIMVCSYTGIGVTIYPSD